MASESTLCRIFHEFCAWYTEVIYPKFVSVPKTRHELEKIMGPYIALGLNGACGSTDAVHFSWGCCPSHLTNLHTGKEGIPTLAYNVTGNHDGSIIFCTAGTYGACNDKTLVRYDNFINEIRTNKWYKNIEYDLRISETVSVKEKGVYCIVDGGYHRWASTMSASRLLVEENFVLWRKRMESVRKDIEDIFGVLKGRFRVLKLPILLHKKEQIDNMVFTCIGLHNMLHVWDKRDEWEAGKNR